jgi:hypothetical protein
MGSLSTNRHPPSVTKPSIATQIHKPLDVHGDLSPQITFHLVITVNDLADGVDLLFGKKI